MILLDAHALIALLADEPAAPEVKLLLAQECGVVPINVAETVDVVERRIGLEHDRLVAALTVLLTGVRTVETTIASAQQAGRLRAKFYSRSASQLSIADCCLLAAAGSGDRIATSDVALSKVAKELDIGLVGLPDRSGRRPA